MKRKIISKILLSILCACTLVGCGAKNDTKQMETEMVATESIKGTTDIMSEVESETVTEIMEDTTLENTDEAENEVKDLTFEDLSKREFIFSSGAGAWGELLTIEKDGSFTGGYHDSEMGSAGEGYENGTVYLASYSGQFSDLVKIDEYTYEMTLTDFTYDTIADTQEIENGFRYIYTTSLFWEFNEEGDIYRVYLPGTPLSQFSEDVLYWLGSSVIDETELTVPIIVDKKSNGSAMYSQERKTPLEEAYVWYEGCKKSYDEYADLLLKATTTAEMVECTGNMYEISDSCLNYLWDLIRDNVSEKAYQQILAEQREWIEQKETQLQSCTSEGSFASVDYNDIAATLTMERCKELLEYLEANIQDSSNAEAQKENIFDSSFLFIDDIDMLEQVELIYETVEEDEDGSLYLIRIDYDEDFIARDYYGHDRTRLGYFYVTDAIVYFVDELDVDSEMTIDTVKLQGKIIYAEQEYYETLGIIAKENDYLEFANGNCIYHYYTQDDENGYYRTVGWNKEQGLVMFRNGFGALRDSIAIYRQGADIERYE